MAVDVEQLAIGLRLSADGAGLTDAQTAILTRLLGVSEAFVELRASGAPQATKDEAVVSMASYMYDRPKAAAERRYADAWANSGAAFIVAPWVVQRLGDASGEALPPSGGGLSDAERARLLPDNAADGQVAVYQDASGLWVAEDIPAGEGGTEDVVARAAAAAAQDVVTHDSAGDSHEDIRDAIEGRVTQDDVETTAQRLIDSAGHATNVDLGVVRDGIQRNADNLTTHEGTPHGGGNGGTPTPTPTPPAVLVDAVVYSAHGDVTAAGWRDYDFVQLFYAVGGNTYITPPVNTVQLIGLSPLVFGMSRNVAWTLAISTTDDDVINVLQSSQGNTVPAPTATSTMTEVVSFV